VSPRTKTTIYRGKTGQWAFVLHRVSGFLVFFFLLLHIVDVSLINRPHIYDEVHELYGNFFLRVFECGLLFALLYHALNGLRIVIVDFFPEGVRSHRTLYNGVIFLTIAAGLPGSFVILKPWIDGNL
jgi:succinate dehydrogenase / fumarate reductase, cytochrome b subunit